MIAFDDARRVVLTAAGIMAAQRVPANASMGRILAEDVFSPEHLPSFDNTAMDGFALATGGQAVPEGTEFVVSAALAAGEAAPAGCEGACEIMTGAPMPDGLDAVIPIELVKVLELDAEQRPQRIRLLQAVLPGINVRRCGQDISAGDLIMPAGTRIDAPERMVLAALGIADIAARKLPVAALLTTGRELVDDPHQALMPGQIRNSNGPFLAERLRECGAELRIRQSLPDEAGAFTEAVRSCLQVGVDLIISTGAVSMGRYDFIPDALRELGADILFHKVAMRPGKPLLFARLPGGALYFGLPGNPVSSAVGMRFFVEPALRACLGLPQESPLRVPLAEAVSKKPGFRMLQKAVLQSDDQGRLSATVMNGQESFRIRPLLQSNAWAVLPEQGASMPAETLVDLYGLNGNGIVLKIREVDHAG
ncbi:MAG: molybdopterin molybdotransferase MoeA [Arenimonas sp.]|nr:molybdopterin molybdotransferase MoeA [Arenimonas sp.]MBP7982084.1 molybdopterin molybdotransferase MoeA [Arenimonas sp.]